MEKNNKLLLIIIFYSIVVFGISKIECWYGGLNCKGMTFSWIFPLVVFGFIVGLSKASWITKVFSLFISICINILFYALEGIIHFNGYMFIFYMILSMVISFSVAQIITFIYKKFKNIEK